MVSGKTDRLQLAPVFENVTGLAVQGFADLFERTESNTLDLAGSQQRQVLLCYTNLRGKVFALNPAAREHDIERNMNRHPGGLDELLVVGFQFESDKQ